MGKVKFSLAVSEIRNKVGSVVYSRNRYGNYVRDYVIPTDPESGAQLEQRSKFRNCMETWATLTESQRSQWNALATQLRGTDIFGNQYSRLGMQLFVQLNIERLVAIEDITLNPPVLTNIPKLGQLSISASWYSGSLIVNLIGGTLTANQSVVITCSAPASTTKNQFANERPILLVVEDATDLPVDIYPELSAKFGTPGWEVRYSIGVYVIDRPSGLRSREIWENVDTPVELDADTINYFAECPTQPPDNVKVVYNNFILSLKAGSNNWAQVLNIWAFGAWYQDNANVNVRQPTLHTITPVGAMAWSQKNGYTSGASGRYLKTDFYPSADGAGIYTQESAGLTIYCLTNTNTGTEVGVNENDGRAMYLASRQGGTAFGVLNQETNSPTFSTSNAIGITTIQRIAGLEGLAFNGNIIDIIAEATIGVPDDEMFICGINNVGSGLSDRSGKQINMVVVHSGLVEFTELFVSIATFRAELLAL